MSWIQKLYETYNNCQSMVGYSTDDGKRPLLPICHITAQADIEIIIDKNGNFKRAKVVDKNDATTIVPSTEGSGAKAGSKPEGHSLCEKLQYIAGDFSKYGGKVTSGFSKKPEEPFNNYIEILSKWCESTYSHPKAEAILEYVQKKSVVKDLVDYKILYCRSDGLLLSKADVKREKNSFDIFSVTDSQDDAFVRWVVESPNILETRVWKDKSLWESWIGFYLNSRQSETICYVTGVPAVLTNNHPKYIRSRSDGGKIISSNDKAGYTYRGRFSSAEQACSVSLEVSQKAHNALIWLIDRQGKVFFVSPHKGKSEPGLSVVAWAIGAPSIPQPTDDTVDILGEDELESDSDLSVDTKQDIGLKLKKKISGYQASIGQAKSIQIISLNSATPGRLAITYYQEIDAWEYFERIDRWHQECAWIHRYRSNKGKGEESIGEDSIEEKRRLLTFFGAPSPLAIAEAAYGERVDDKLKQATIARIIPCIVEGRQIPRDLFESTVRRACNRIALKNWEWEKALSIACALYRKFNRKENYTMALDPERRTRDYLYGRLLAIADRLEEVALYKAKEDRATNAARYMQQFSQRPYTTWNQIHAALTPYIVRLKGATYYKNLIGEVKCLFDDEDFVSNKSLTGEYLLGYYCQRQELWKKTREKQNDKEDKPDIEDQTEN